MDRHLGILFAVLERFADGSLDDTGADGQAMHEADGRFGGKFDQLRFQFVEARGELGLHGFLDGLQLLVSAFGFGLFQLHAQGGELRLVLGSSLVAAALVAGGFLLDELFLVRGAGGFLGQQRLGGANGQPDAAQRGFGYNVVDGLYHKLFFLLLAFQ